MKIYSLLLILLTSSVGLAQNDKDPVIEFLTGQPTELDLDGDGLPDIFQKYKDGKLLETTFAPSANPSYKEITAYITQKRFHRRTYSNNKLIEEERVTPTDKGYISDKIIHGPKAKRVKITYFDKHIITESYSWVKGQWKKESEVKQSNDPVYEDTSQRKRTSSHSTSRLQAVNPIAFRIDRSCNSYDYAALTHATRFVAKKISHCLSKINSRLAYRLMENLRANQNLIKCHQKDPKGRDVASYTTMKKDGIIHLVAKTPTIYKQRYGFNDLKVVNDVGSTLFHEILHHLGIPHKHNKNPRKKRSDAVYGCQGLCDDQFEYQNIDIYSSCKDCFTYGKTRKDFTTQFANKMRRACAERAKNFKASQ